MLFLGYTCIARIIDRFVNHLDLKKYGIKEPASEGRPAYNPKSLYKLYIYGSRKGIRSSRKLAESCKVNLEVKWLIDGVEPDFRTISDFRKNNIDSMRDIFYDFNRCIAGEVEWGFVSVDGSKFHANNSKNNNFTKNKLDDRIKWLNGHTDEYLRILNEMDEQEDADDTQHLTRELVYCPAGNILRQKSIRKSGSICYANKNACKHCKNRNKCYKGKVSLKRSVLAKTSYKNPARIG